MSKWFITIIGCVLMAIGNVSASILVHYDFEDLNLASTNKVVDKVGPVYSNGDGNGGLTVETNGISGTALGFHDAQLASAGKMASEFKITSDFTVTLWVNLAPLPNTQDRLIDSSNGTGAIAGVFGWRLMLNDSTPGNAYKLQFQANGSVGPSTVNKTFTTLQNVQHDGNWTFVAVRYDTTGNVTTTVLYDSQLGGDTSLLATNSESVASDGVLNYGSLAIPHLGSDASTAGGRFLNGTLDEIRLYDTVLTDTELIDVFNSVSNTTPVMTAYEVWSNSYSLAFGPAGDDDSDGLLNLYEYGLGGNPTNPSDQGISPGFAIQNIGGTNYFGYVYPQLADPASGITYHLELTPELVFPSWTNAGYVVYGTNVTGNAFDFVTNVTSTVENKKFVRLIIE